MIEVSTAANMDMPLINNKKKNILLSLFPYAFIIFTIGLVYYPSSSFEFLNFDDNIYITQNEFVNSGLSWNNIKAAFSSFHAGHYHPLTWLSLQADVEFFGLKSNIMHKMNLLIHILNACLLLWLLKKLFKTNPTLFLPVLIYACHPLRIESVVWITERKDLLSLFFLLISLHFYTNYVTKNTKGPFLLSLVFFVLSLLSKPSPVIYPFGLLLFDFWPLKRSQNTKRLLLEKLPFFLCSIIFVIFVFNAQNQAGAIKLTQFSFFEKINNATLALGIYFLKSFWPDPIAIFYPAKTFPYWQGILTGTLALVILFYSWKKKTIAPALIFSALWFVLFSLPILGLIPVGGQFIADRWTLLPQLGFVFLIATWMDNHDLKFQPLLLLIVLLGFITKTQFELKYWKDSEMLFTHTLAVTQNNYLAHTNLGQALELKGNFQSAELHYRKALSIHPNYGEALNNLAGIEMKKGNLEMSEKLLKQALMRNPRNHITLFNLGIIYYQNGLFALAFDTWEKVYYEKPNYEALISLLNHLKEKKLEQTCNFLIAKSKTGPFYTFFPCTKN